MKKLSLLIALLVCLSIVLCGCGSAETRYSEFYSMDGKEEFDIPGLDVPFVPQGMCYVDESEVWLVCGYMSSGDDKNSRLYVVGDEVVCIKLLKDDNTNYTAHAGGITSSGSDVWIVSGNDAYRFDIADILATENNGYLAAKDSFDTACGGATCFAADGLLWVAEFYESRDYKIEGHNFKVSGGTNYAIACAYTIDTNGQGGVSSEIPIKILSLGEKVQGITIGEQIVTSTSYGRKNDSYLYFYDNPLNNAADATFTVGDTQVPVWFLDDDVLTKKLKAPTMTEGIELVDGRLYVLFESAAEKYTAGSNKSKYPHDSVWSILDD